MDEGALLTEAARAALNERLAAVVLYGSRVRGQARENSDLNLLVVAEGLPASLRGRRELARQLAARVRTAGLTQRLSAKLVTPQELADDTAEGGALALALAQGSALLWASEPSWSVFLSDLQNRYAYDKELGAWTWSKPS